MISQPGPVELDQNLQNTPQISLVSGDETCQGRRRWAISDGFQGLALVWDGAETRGVSG
jgi:hypothetical protein